MDRRNMLLRAAAAISAVFAASGAKAATETPNARLTVVYHLNDLDKVNFVLSNIQNHFDGAGGPDNVTIALVVHGPALRAFHAASANPDITKRVGLLARTGVRFAACGNTMKSQQVTVTELLPGFVEAEKGGVVRIAELQSQGYLYLRP